MTKGSSGEPKVIPTTDSMPSQDGENSIYGYSSGRYAKLFPTLDNTGLIPLQEEIDSLEGGISKQDWETRFDLVFNRAKDSKVGSAMGEE